MTNLGMLIGEVEGINPPQVAKESKTKKFFDHAVRHVFSSKKWLVYKKSLRENGIWQPKTVFRYGMGRKFAIIPFRFMENLIFEQSEKFPWSLCLILKSSRQHFSAAIQSVKTKHGILIGEVEVINLFWFQKNLKGKRFLHHSAWYSRELSPGMPLELWELSLHYFQLGYYSLKCIDNCVGSFIRYTASSCIISNNTK